MITNVEYRDGHLYCAEHVALVRCRWQEQTYLGHPAYWCPACKEFVAGDAVPEEARRAIVDSLEGARILNEAQAIQRRKQFADLLDTAPRIGYNGCASEMMH